MYNKQRITNVQTELRVLKSIDQQLVRLRSAKSSPLSLPPVFQHLRDQLLSHFHDLFRQIRSYSKTRFIFKARAAREHCFAGRVSEEACYDPALGSRGLRFSFPTRWTRWNSILRASSIPDSVSRKLYKVSLVFSSLHFSHADSVKAQIFPAYFKIQKLQFVPVCDDLPRFFS